MGTPNFTTYANVKAWLALTSDTDQAMITRLISEASRTMLAWLQRPSLWKSSYNNELYDGYGTGRMMLDQWPVLAISSLMAGDTSIPVMPSPQSSCGYGYILQAWNGAPPGTQQEITLRGGCFPYGQSNIAVSYTAGYSVANEAQTIPAGNPYQITVNQPQGAWGQDDGVTYANGTPLTPVTGAPAQGQYNPPTTTLGLYTFAAADAGQAVLISYSYTPFDLEQGCIEIVSERYRYKSRIGQKSTSVSGAETASYDLSAIPQAVQMRMLPYRRKVVI